MSRQASRIGLIFFFMASLVWISPVQGQRFVVSSAPFLNDALDSTSFDRDTWRSLTEGLEYPTKEKKKKKVEKPNTKKGSPLWDRLSNLGPALTIVLIISGLFLLSAILLRIFGEPANKRISKSDHGISLQAVEDNLEDSDLPSMIQKAKRAGDYTLALRFYYLNTLKQLASKNLIRWQKDKTNREYEHELQGSRFEDNFSQLTNQFEWVCYGGLAVTADTFQEMEPFFQQFLQSINHEAV